jgi:hypothetical protein
LTEYKDGALRAIGLAKIQNLPLTVLDIVVDIHEALKMPTKQVLERLQLSIEPMDLSQINDKWLEDPWWADEKSSKFFPRSVSRTVFNRPITLKPPIRSFMKTKKVIHTPSLVCHIPDNC